MSKKYMLVSEVPILGIRVRFFGCMAEMLRCAKILIANFPEVGQRIKMPRTIEELQDYERNR